MDFLLLAHFQVSNYSWILSLDVFAFNPHNLTLSTSELSFLSQIIFMLSKFKIDIYEFVFL